MGAHERVTDWRTDFDHTDDAWAADPFPIWDELRRTCPVAHSERFAGVWLPTRHEDIATIAHDTERFTSRTVIVTEYRPSAMLEPEGIAPPISSDPPYHGEARRILLPVFAPQEVAKRELSIRAYCHELVEELEGRATFDAAEQYAQRIPVRVLADMIGLPESEADVFMGFVEDVLAGVTQSFDERIAGMMDLFDYLSGHIDDRVANPRDDLITYLLDSEIHGEKLDAFQVGRTLGLLLVAGIDSTSGAIGASLWHLGTNPGDRRRLVAEPALMPTAVEELLRAYVPVTMARLVKQDMEFNGCAMAAEDFVLLAFPAANRDPEAFEDADQVILDRQVNRHAAFGLGIHRCVGSHLARMQLRVALEVFLEAFPDFELADPEAVRWSTGQIRGPKTLPLRIG